MALNVSEEEAFLLMLLSFPMTVVAITVSVWGAYKSLRQQQENAGYFLYNAILSNLFNCGSCICVSTYLVWLAFYPLGDEHFFLTHPSIRLRIATTVSWYLSKIFLFLIFNGRLYFAFKNSMYRSNRTVFIVLNVFVVVHAIASLITGYVGVLVLRNEIVANIGFNTFHLNLAILLFYLSFQFNRRMFVLSTSKIHIEVSQRSRTETARDETVVSNEEFLTVVTRSTLLLTWIIPFMISISLTWSLHRFAFDTTHFSMCIALLIMALDAFVDVICVTLLFKYADIHYGAFCKCRWGEKRCARMGCDYCFNRCCYLLARKCT